MAFAAPLSYGEKPRLRGVSHQWAFFGFALANGTLLLQTRGRRAQLAVLIYALSVAFLYGVSALYHRVDWSAVVFQRIRRLDHSAIFLLIAGSYTPLFLVLLPESQAQSPLLLVWLFATLGVAKSIFWSRSPSWVTTCLALGAGWCGVDYVLNLGDAMGSSSLYLLVGSGVLYTVGGVVYALRRPDPMPKTFGYHEVFHALVVAGGIMHHVHVRLMLANNGAV